MGIIKTKWLVIGVQFGIPRSKLETFKEDRDPFSLVVDYWLRGNVPESVSPKSWESIVTALKSGEPETSIANKRFLKALVSAIMLTQKLAALNILEEQLSSTARHVTS